MAKTIRVTDIVWDVDGYDPAEFELPSDVDLTEEQIDYDIDENGYQDLDEAITDYLSDEYGWLVRTFNFEVLGPDVGSGD